MQSLFNIHTYGTYAPIVLKGSFAPRNYPFSKSLTVRHEKLLLMKSTVAETATVIGKYEIWECLLSHLEGCLL